MPDHENTFVLKADNIEYVIEAKDSDDMRSWLATIRYCMRTPPTTQIPPNAADTSLSVVTASPNAAPTPIPGAQSMPSDGGGGGGGGGTGSVAAASPGGGGAAPEIPPRRAGDRISTSSNFELADGDQEAGLLGDSSRIGHESDPDLTATMREYPWFHYTLARSEAAQLVLHSGAAGHGKW